jgi:hypothetical protein
VPLLFSDPTQRDVDSAERAILGGPRFHLYTLIEVREADGDWRSLSALAGADWFDGAAWGQTIDQPTWAGTIRLKRAAKIGGVFYSLVPLLQTSPLNLDGSMSYVPLLDVTREVRILVASTAPGVAPVSGDWKTVFYGVIDDIDWAGDPITLTVRDIGAKLMDPAWIEDPVPINLAAPAALHTTIQAILDDPPATPATTLNVPTAPTWMVKEFQPDPQPKLTLIRALAQQIGWDVRYMWSGADNFLLTLYEPERTRTTPHYTFPPDEYE